MGVDATQLEQYLALLETADQAIDRDLVVRMRAATQRLMEYSRSIEHVVTGNMRNSTYSLGPFASGGGVLESIIASGAPYTIDEISKGGDHDWMTRTLQEQAAVLDALADEAGRIVVTSITGGV